MTNDEAIFRRPGHGWQLWPGVPYVFTNGSNKPTKIAVYVADPGLRRIAVVKVGPRTRATIPAKGDWQGEESILHEPL
jgi:hypothetical protein